MGRRTDGGKRGEWIETLRRKTSGLTVAKFFEWDGVGQHIRGRQNQQIRGHQSGRARVLTQVPPNRAGPRA